MDLRYLLYGVAFVLSIGCTGDPEPHFEGRPLSFWIEELSAEDDDRQLLAIEAITEFGSNAGIAVIPLAKILRDQGESEAVREAVQQTLDEIKFTPEIEDVLNSSEGINTIEEN